MTAAADSLLIERAQTGDEGAFSQLLDGYYNVIYRFALRWSGQVDDAEDITQLACIKLARNIDQYRFESAFTSWLYRLVINCAKDWYKAEGRHRTSDNLAPEPESRANAHEQNIYLAQVIEIVDGLGKDMKETALLVFAEGLSHREVADVFNVKESTISWRIHEIRKQLQLIKQQESRL